MASQFNSFWYVNSIEKGNFNSKWNVSTDGVTSLILQLSAESPQMLKGEKKAWNVETEQYYFNLLRLDNNIASLVCAHADAWSTNFHWRVSRSCCQMSLIESNGSMSHWTDNSVWLKLPVPSTNVSLDSERSHATVQIIRSNQTWQNLIDPAGKSVVLHMLPCNVALKECSGVSNPAWAGICCDVLTRCNHGSRLSNMGVLLMTVHVPSGWVEVFS